jgi:tetratricopeptide (TPR) repeat protein
VRVLIRLAVILFVLAAVPTAASAAPSADLVRAREAFQRGDYPVAIPLLNYLLYPTPRLSDRSELAEAHLLLGVAYFETGNHGEARAEFDKALRQDEGLQLDPLFVSKEAVDFFERSKDAFKKKAKEDADKRRLAEELAAYRKALANLIVIEKRPYYVNFIPFGAGQFQNGDNGKGIFFSVAQGLTGGTSAIIFGYHAIKYGFGGQVPREEASGVRRQQQIQIGAGIACLGLMAWGIVDSLMNYEPAIQRTADESLLPDDFKPDLPRRRRGKRGPSSFRITPAPQPGGGGVVMSWEF